MRFLTPIAVLLGCCGALLAAAQDLKPADLIAMKKYKLGRIDSLAQAKGFKKFKATEETGFSIYMYLYQGVEGSATVQRNLQVGLRSSIHDLTLEYVVWSKAEATRFIDQLTSSGFKKVVRAMPVIGSTEMMQTVSYKNGANEFSYNERKQSGETLFLFSTSNEHYQP
jgi:hypothetical protein